MPRKFYPDKIRTVPVLKFDQKDDSGTSSEFLRKTQALARKRVRILSYRLKSVPNPWKYRYLDISTRIFLSFRSLESAESFERNRKNVQAQH
ncbi:hypothetical protein CH370_04015 [Leptospira kmetyi]|nr:hypothetical protein LEP1GSC052_1097 [Leptospira kmetyi serovar Malaysia str. Bejo-Iso9]PJZ42401.1 hypothetical protein CH370_04015 [Leptospira kmetyi]